MVSLVQHCLSSLIGTEIQVVRDCTFMKVPPRVGSFEGTFEGVDLERTFFLNSISSRSPLLRKEVSVSTIEGLYSLIILLCCFGISAIKVKALSSFSEIELKIRTIAERLHFLEPFSLF